MTPGSNASPFPFAIAMGTTVTQTDPDCVTTRPVDQELHGHRGSPQ